MKKLIFSILLLSLTGCSVVSMQEENDIFGITKNQDNMYSQGLTFRYFDAAENAPKILKDATNYIPSLSVDKGLTANKYTAEMSQQMYTPDDLRPTTPIYGQNPYVGVLYGKIGKEEISEEERKYADLMVGVTGHWSYADVTQSWFHHMIGMDRPQGWDNQVDNEIVAMHQSGMEARDFEIKYRENKFQQTSGYDLSLGTWNTSLQFFVEHTFGYNYELFSAPKNDAFAWHFFNKPYFQIVARDMTLDGNTFHESKVTVDKKPFVFGNCFGVEIEWKGYALDIGVTTQSKIYDEQTNPWHTWGGWTVTKKFDLY